MAPAARESCFYIPCAVTGSWRMHMCICIHTSQHTHSHSHLLHSPICAANVQGEEVLRYFATVHSAYYRRFIEIFFFNCIFSKLHLEKKQTNKKNSWPGVFAHVSESLLIEGVLCC